MIRAASALLCVLLFFVTVYRAATQSITIDEAYTYTQFVARPLASAMAEYDANNHVLYTLGARVSTGLLGVSDLTLRLPALAGAALFYGSLWWLCAGLVAGEAAWLAPLGIALVGANTYVLDLLPLARGYGLGLGLFAFALASAVRERRPLAVWTGVALGLSVAANLTFAAPVAALLGALLWLDRDRLALRTALAAASSAMALLAWPLSHAGRDHFYFGTSSPVESLCSLVGASLAHNWNERGGPVPVGAAVAASVLVAAVALVVARRRTRARFLVGVTVAGSAGLLAVGHLAAGLPLPFGRTGFYWILLFGAAVLTIGSRVVAVAISVAAMSCYAMAWSTEYSADWQFDAGTRLLAERLAAIPRTPGDPRARVAASDLLAGSLDYYRLTRGWTWMEPVARGDKLRATGGERFDYYVVIGDDREWAARAGKSVIAESAVAGSALMR